MALVRKIGRFLGISRLYLATYDDDIVDANATTDADFSEGIGRKADTAYTDAATTTKSLMAMVKGILNLLQGTTSMMGGPIALTGVKLVALGTSGNVGYRTAGGTALSGAVAGGNILLKKATAQILGAAVPTGAFDSLWISVVTASAIKVNVPFRKLDGTLFDDTAAALGAIGYAELNHIITTADVVRLYTETAAITGTGPTFTLSGIVLTKGATLLVA